MATVLAFPDRRTGDWTEAERSRIRDLAARYAGEAGVEVAFGLTDAGDPWCVVLDGADEVLLHIARINGSFVAHAGPAEVFAEARDWRSVMEVVLGPKWQERDTAVPAEAAIAYARIATTVLVAAVFVDHDPADASHLWSLISAPIPLGANARTGGRAKVEATSASALDPDLASVAHQPWGQASDLLADVIRNTPISYPADLKTDERGAPPSVHKVGSVEVAGGPREDEAVEVSILLGAAVTSSREAGQPGDNALTLDTLILDDASIIIGTEASERFMVPAPPGSGVSTLLGIIVGFDPEADTIAVDGVADPAIVSRVKASDIAAMPDAFSNWPSAPWGERIGLDIDGDGIEDGYVLVGGSDGGGASTIFADASDVVSALAAPHDPIDPVSNIV